MTSSTSEDVARANVAALAALGEGHTAYNVGGSGDPHTVGEMATALAAEFGGPMPVVTGEFRLGDVRHITADSARLRDELGWKPEVEFVAGVAEFAFAPLRSPARG